MSKLFKLFFFILLNNLEDLDFLFFLNLLINLEIIFFKYDL
jgi:hypothetical protein